jgi:hypothetical protein
MRAGRFMASYIVIGIASLVPLALTLACGGPPVAATQPTITAVPTRAVPTIAAAPTDVMATANALRTQIAPTLNAAATQFAPTMVAVQTQTVPTLEAIGTEVVPTVNAAATTTAESAIRITDAQLTSGAPTITVENVGDRTIDLSAWSLQVGDKPVKLPPNTELAPGKSLVLHGSAGTNDNDNIYLGSSFDAALNALQPGAQVLLENPSGSPVASFTVPSAQ